MLSDLEAALGETKATKATTTKRTTTTATAAVPAPKGKKVPKKDCEIDDENRLTNYNGTEKHIILPQGIEIIGENAFMSSEIESVVVPEGVEKIEDSGFWGCKSLKSVTLPSSLEVIEGDAFRMCEELRSIVIPEGVTEIGMDAFTSCNKLKDIYLPDSLWDIGYDAFCTFCDGMTLHVPKGSDAETYAKDNDIKYDNKKAPAVSAGSTSSSRSTAKSTPAEKSAPAPAKSAVRSTSSPSDFTIEKGVLTGYTGTATDVIIPTGVTKIARSVFNTRKNVVSVKIPETVTEIEEWAFYNCEDLAEITIPEGIVNIDDYTFNGCGKLQKLVIPQSVKRIGDSAFCFCPGMKDVYVPASVEEIHEYAFLAQFNGTLHIPAGSYAESFAKRRNITCDNNVAGIWSAATKVKEEVGYFSSAVSGLNTQIAELDSQELSAEDREILNQVKEQMNAIGDQLEQGQAQMGKYGDYLEQKEQREKAAEEEKARLKAEALAAGKSEKDIVNMYIILTNEKKLGMLHRSADDFYETYEDDFSALSKEEVISTRKDMLAEMDDETLCAYYAASFKQRSVEDRFSVSTRNLNNVNPEPEMTVKATWAIENSKEWYQESELAEVRRLMDADLAHTRADLDSQFDTIDSAWKKFATGKEFLQIAISDKAADGSDLDDNFSNFQIVVGTQLVAVQIASKGIFRMSTTIMNCFTWYWGVTVREIWEAAMKNDIYDSREGASNGSQLANQAMNQIRAKYPTAAPTSAPKSAATSYSKPTTPPAPSKPVQTATPTQPAKKEGCYIATAVYGSYDAPQVLTLRRFRDDVLAHSVLGRCFIRTYYRLSPPIAERLKDAKMINGWVRSILDKIVSKLNNKQHH